MDFKALREQILTNIDHYNNEEMKIVVTKLLDFLIEISEKRSKLEAENKALFQEMNDLRRSNDTDSNSQYKSKINDIVTKTNEEKEKIIENAHKQAEDIINDANNKAQSIIELAKEKEQEIIKTSIEKIETIIKDIKKKDEEAMLYRKHILSIFRKTIFRFSDTNYYIVRSDNKDFRELLQFFETDEKLQELCDKNMEKLMNDSAYQALVEMVKDNPVEENIVRGNNILKDDKVTIDNKTIELKEYELEEIDDEITINDLDEEFEESHEEMKQHSNAKFLDVINQYKNK